MPPTEIEDLRRRLDQIDFSNFSLRAFKDLPVMDYGFFPGGNGLFSGVDGSITKVKTLVLGSNFGCDSKFVDGNRCLRVRDERTSSPTWSSKGGLKNSLPRTVAIKLEECFFTNAWPFLHFGTSNDGAPIDEWLRNEKLMEESLSFFLNETLPIVKPQLIIALGKGPAAFLNRLWPEPLEPWFFECGSKWDKFTFSKLDRLFFNSVDCAYGSPFCVILTHPSKAHINAKFRKSPYSGLDGETFLLDTVAEKAGLYV